MTLYKKDDIIQNVEITGYASLGKSLSKIGNLVVFVENAVPGDIVNIKILKVKSNYLEAKVIDILKKSDKRIDPICKHFGICGGCKWQYLKYEEQLNFKQNEVVSNITKIAKVNNFEVNEIIASPQVYEYRNKMEYSFSNIKYHPYLNTTKDNAPSPALGFHISGIFDKVLDIEYCHLQKKTGNEIRNWLKEFAITNNLEFYNIRENVGFLRNLIIRTTSTDEIMIIVVFGYEDDNKINKTLTALHKKFPQIKSLNYIINKKLNSSTLDLEVHHFSGDIQIKEKIGKYQFIITPKSFFQTNTLQAENLYNIVKSYISQNNNEKTKIIYDLYTGTGTIACYVAENCEKVIGIESVEEAVETAKKNALINNINNSIFITGDMKDIFNKKLIQKYGKPDIIITDPPRDGMHKKVVKNILEIMPKKIIYVSCNPATQARDICLLSEKYKLTKIQPVDMFPHTFHVENVALLELKNQIQ